MTTTAQFYKGAALHSGRIGIFPGAFNPVTRAHLAVGRAAQQQHQLDQVVFLLPRQFPHKEYAGASFDERVVLLGSALEESSELAIASSEGGLFIEIAREFRAACGSGVTIHLICGRDAAERIVNWDYGAGVAFEQQLEEFELLVAAREGEYVAPPRFESRIHPIELPSTYSEVSSSTVREAIARGKNWEDLVPQPVAAEIQRQKLYRST